MRLLLWTVFKAITSEMHSRTMRITPRLSVDYWYVCVYPISIYDQFVSLPLSYPLVWLDYCNATRKLCNGNGPLLSMTKCRYYFNKAKVQFGCDFTISRSRIVMRRYISPATIASVNTSVHARPNIHIAMHTVAGLAFRNGTLFSTKR